MGVSCAVLLLLSTFKEQQNLSHCSGSRRVAVSRISQLGLCFLHSSQPLGQPSLLMQYRESGLSSSSYELSQYIRDGADHYDPVLPGSWSPTQGGEA